MEFLKKNKIVFFNIFILFFLFFIVMNYQRYDILFEHDRWNIYRPFEQLVSLGRIPGVLVNIFLYQYIPNLFPSINLNDLQPTIIAFVKSLFVILIVFLYLKIFYLFSENKSVFKNKSFCISSFIIFCLIFNNYNISNEQGFLLIHDSRRFMDYYLPLLLYIYFIYILLIIFVISKKLKKYLFIISLFLFFLLGLSNEMLAVFSFCNFSFLIFLQILFVFINSKFSNFIEIGQLITIKKNYMQVIVLYCVLVISIILYFFTSNYKTFENAGGGHSIDYVEGIWDLKSNLIDFLQNVYSLYIHNYEYIYISIFLLFILIYINKEKYYQNVLLFTFSIIWGLIYFFMLMLFCGDSSAGEFFISHVPIRHICFKIIILILFILFGYNLNNTNKKNFISFLLIFYFLFNLFSNNFYNFIPLYSSDISKARKLRLISYASDKVALESSMLDGNLVLPISFYQYTNFALYKIKHACYDCFGSFQTMDKIVEKEILSKKSRVFSFYGEQSDDSATDNYYFLYLKHIYNIELETLQFKKYDSKDYSYRKKILGNTQNTTHYVWFSSLNELKRKKIDYDKLVRNFPNKAFVYASRARYNKKQGNIDLAIFDYSNALYIEPDNLSYLFSRALLYKEIGDIKNAISDLEKVIKLSPNSIYAQYLLVEELEKNGNYDSAIKICNNLIELFPFGYADQEPDFYIKRAMLKEKVKDYQGAIDDYKKSLEISTYSYIFDINKKIALNEYNIREYSKTIDYLNIQLLYTPFDNSIYFYRGEAFFNLHFYSNAIDDFLHYIRNVDIDNYDTEDLQNLKKLIAYSNSFNIKSLLEDEQENLNDLKREIIENDILKERKYELFD